jgi:aminotransferase
MSEECERVGGINLGQGVCDLPTPPVIADAAKRAIDRNLSTYTAPEGDPRLRCAIAEKLGRENGIYAEPEHEIVVTSGTTGAFAAALHGLLDPGDGILLIEPYYDYHVNCARLAGLEPHYITLEPPAFALGEEAVREAVRPHTRAIVVCTPANPSGKMFTRFELEAIARLAHEHDLLVITDEVYEYMRYDGRPHISPATVGDLWPRSVTIMGLSKTFAITGWRLGYAVAVQPMAQAIARVSDLLCVCAPRPLQHAVSEGFGLPGLYFESLALDFQCKRDRLCSALAAAGAEPFVPEGAHYVLTDVSSWGFASAGGAAAALLEGGKVAAVPGTAFYRDDGGRRGESLLRFCFAKEDAVLDEACERISAFRPAP